MGPVSFDVKFPDVDDDNDGGPVAGNYHERLSFDHATFDLQPADDVLDDSAIEPAAASKHTITTAGQGTAFQSSAYCLPREYGRAGRDSLNEDSRDHASITCAVFKHICTIMFTCKNLDAKKGKGTTTRVVALLDRVGVTKVWSWFQGKVDNNPALREVIQRGSWTDLASSHAIGGDLRSVNPGWYANIIDDTTHPGWLKMYIGHSKVLEACLGDHAQELTTEDNDLTHHYMIATRPNRRSAIISFAIDDEAFDIGLLDDFDQGSLMLLIEHYFCCPFQTIP